MADMAFDGRIELAECLMVFKHKKQRVISESMFTAIFASECDHHSVLPLRQSDLSGRDLTKRRSKLP